MFGNNKEHVGINQEKTIYQLKKHIDNLETYNKDLTERLIEEKKFLRAYLKEDKYDGFYVVRMKMNRCGQLPIYKYLKVFADGGHKFNENKSDGFTIFKNEEDAKKWLTPDSTIEKIYIDVDFYKEITK